MTGRERSLRALSFQEADRAPIGGYFSHGPFLEEASGIRPWWQDPQECLRRTYRNLGVDAIGANVLPKTPEQSAELEDGWPGISESSESSIPVPERPGLGIELGPEILEGNERRQKEQL